MTQCVQIEGRDQRLRTIQRPQQVFTPQKSYKGPGQLNAFRQLLLSKAQFVLVIKGLGHLCSST